MRNTNTPDHKDNAGTRGMKWLGRLIAIISILVVAAFGDVMYIVLMSNKFPSGPLLIVCYLGAITSFLCTVYLLIGKSTLFSPGPQMAFSWIVLAVELVLIAMNIVLVFSGSNASQLTEAWSMWVAPITPVINLVGIIVLYFLDAEQVEKHEDMEMHAELRKQARDYDKAVATAKLALQYKQLDYLTSELERATDNPATLATLRDHANEMSNALLTSLTGRSYARPTKVVEANPTTPQLQQASFAQTSGINIGFDQLTKLLGGGKKEETPATPEPDPQPTPATPAASTNGSSNKGRKLSDEEVNEAIRQYHDTGVMPDGWSSRRMKAYIRHRYPNGAPSKHNNLS